MNDHPTILESQMLTPAKVGWVLDVGESTVAAWLRCADERGRRRAPLLTHFRQGRLIRVMPAAALDFILRHTVRAASGIEGGGVKLADGDWGRIERLIAVQLEARRELAA